VEAPSAPVLSLEGLMVPASALIVDEVSVQSEVDTVLHNLEPAWHERPGEECHEKKATDAAHASSIDGIPSDRNSFISQSLSGSLKRRDWYRAAPRLAPTSGPSQ
jgi:hypothetical protein